jgi:short-subunit dehydrogenase
MELAGRTVLVTGASGGLGGAIARALHVAGARLVLSGRRADALEALAGPLGARTVVADLADPSDVERLLAEAGAVDALVANAGLSSSGALSSFTTEQATRAVAVNLTAPLLLAGGLADAMAQRGEGHLVFVSSLSGMTGQAGAALYSATKFGLRGAAQALRAELRPRGVGVSCVLPGFVRDAGIFHDAGGRAPWYLGTCRAADVAGAVVVAIERDRAELLVAPIGLRLMTRFAAAAPVTAARLARRVGGDRIAGRIVGRLAERAPRD